MSVEVGETV